MKIRTLIITTIAALAVTGCTREIVVVQEPAPTTTVVTTTTVEATTTTKAPPVRISDDELFLDQVKSETSLYPAMSNADILEMGYTMCEFLRAGGTAEELIQVILDAGAENSVSEQVMLDYAALAGLAVANLCPDMGWKI
jgi:hypothetical protein